MTNTIQGPPVVIMASGGVPVTNLGAAGATPFTVNAAFGMGVTLVDAGGLPVTLLDETGGLYNTLVFSGSVIVPEDTATSSSLGTFAVVGGSGSYTFAITAGNGAGKFSISTATLVLAGALNYEAVTSYALTITANNGVDPILTLHLTLNVGNVAEKPVNLTLPVITGSATYNSTLTGSNGTWTDQSGATYAYRWFADAVAIGGATANTFLVTHTQEGKVITFGVIATNSAASSDEAVSAATSAVPDATPPTVSSFSPLDDATGVSVSGNLVVTFSENVAFHSAVVISLRKTSDDSVIQAFTEADIAGAIAISGAALTINPTSDLANSTGYYILIGATSIKDLAGNFFAGIAVKTTWNFTSAALASTDTFNSADKAGITLSGGDLIATYASTTDAQVRSHNSHSTGKYHFEFTVNALTNAGYPVLGIASASHVFSNYCGQDLNSFAFAPGHVFYLNASGGGVADPLDATFGTGVIVALEIDLDGKLAKINVGNVGTDPPHWSTTTIDLSSMTNAPFFICVNLKTAGDQVTLNAGGSAYAVTPTAGFGNW